jgi:2-octaprenyl-6-methoxyphenol hydroxylase
LLVGADGARSPSRDFAGISTKDWDYPQTAITAMFTHERDHQDIATEFHTREGPFTLVPLPGFRSSLVWMMKPEKAERLLKLDKTEFTRLVEKQAHHMLGRMTLESERGQVSMRGMKVETAARNRVALVGEAAHVFPPIGAQGLNLGLRDVQSLIDSVGNEPSFDAALKAYASDRARDIGTRTQGVDLLNRSLIAGILPADFARGIGLVALQTISPLRKLAMRAGMGLPFAFPKMPPIKNQ